MRINSELPTDIQILVDLASQIQFRRHPYVRKTSDHCFELVSDRRHRRLSDLRDLIDRSLFYIQNSHSSSLSETLFRALGAIEQHISRKLRRDWIKWHAHRREQLDKLCHVIRGYCDHLHREDVSSEALVRLDFYQSVGKTGWIRPLAASPAELKAMRVISQVIWRGVSQSPKDYHKLMWQLYIGNRLDVEDCAARSLFGQLKDLGASLYKVPGPKPSQYHLLTGPMLHGLAFGKEGPLTWLHRDNNPPSPLLHKILLRYTLGNLRKRLSSQKSIRIPSVRDEDLAA